MKKIVHICLCGRYTDGFNYQENMLSKYQVKKGYDVYLIASQCECGRDTKTIINTNTNYINEDGVRIFRLRERHNRHTSYKFKRYINFYETLNYIHPDIIFVHNVQFLDVKNIVKYMKKHNDVRLFVDNHADFSNSGRNILSRYILHGIIWKHMAKIIEPYTIKFFGVLPARVDFLENIYLLPKEKCELLIMGADDELVDKYMKREIITKNKSKLNISNKDFVIVTGGKINKTKYQTLILMKAVSKLKDENIKLFIFGSIDESIKSEFDSLCCNNIQYLGWADQEESYKNFSIADLVVFPGRHSVYWEQVVGMGIPLVCKYWDGTTHIDINGNVTYLKQDSVSEIKNVLKNIIYNKKEYPKMLEVSKSSKHLNFLYGNIVDKSILEKK